MAIELLEDTAHTLEFYPDEVPSSATVSVYKPGGSAVVDAQTATVDPVSLAVSSVSADPQVMTLGGVTGLTVGRRYRIQRSETFEGSIVEIAHIGAGNVITLAEPPAFTPAADDRFMGLRLSYSLTASHTADRGMNYRVVWRVTPVTGADVKSYREVAHVVRQTFRPPATAEDVSRYLAFAFPSAATARNIEALKNIADRATAAVRRIIEASGRYPALFGDADAFKAAGLIAVKLELIDESLYPGNVDMLDYSDLLRRQLKETTREAVQALSHYDKNDDNVVDGREVGPWSTRVIL